MLDFLPRLVTRHGIPAVRLALLAVALTALVGCESDVSIPAGSQLLHVAVEGHTVSVEPERGLHAGRVYMVIETPGSVVAFVQALDEVDATPGPLDEDHLARLARGDGEHTSVESFGPTCTGPEGEAGRGKIARPGGCGNVYRLALAPGKYALLADDPDTGASPASGMAVVEVLP